jgi:hypothetical protein
VESFKLIKIPKERIEQSWQKLQKRETFVKSQFFPYKVEFDNKSQEGFFSPDELNIHHGPFLHLPAILGCIDSSYRDLKYLYGAYVISFRLIRPVRLEFFRQEDSIELKLTSYIHPWLKAIWPRMTQFFWAFFKV